MKRPDLLHRYPSNKHGMSFDFGGWSLFPTKPYSCINGVSKISRKKTAKDRIRRKARKFRERTQTIDFLRQDYDFEELIAINSDGEESVDRSSAANSIGHQNAEAEDLLTRPVQIESDSDTDDDGVHVLAARAVPKGRGRSKTKLHFRAASRICHKEIIYTKDNCVEMSDGHILRIRSIGRSSAGSVLIGDELVPTSELRTKIQEEDNAYVWSCSDQASIHIKHQDFGLRKPVSADQILVLDHGNPLMLDGLSVYNVQDIFRPCQVVFTNQPPNKEFLDTVRMQFPDAIQNAALYLCRWKMTQNYCKGKVSREIRIERLSFSEADEIAAVNRYVLRFHHRGNTKLGGSGFLRNEPVYDMGDAFCGAGGVSTGARLAGVFVRWAFDSDKDAVETYRLNCEGQRTKVYNNYVDEFLNGDKRHVRVDILHISPPCQPFSPANTKPNTSRNERNQATLLSVGHLLRHVKPRIVTLEQTDGIANRHTVWLDAMLKSFTDEGYSVSFKILRVAHWGVPQIRKRLILFAAAPGEILPNFPVTTHSPYRRHGLRKTSTILECINGIPADSSHMNTATLCRDPKPEYDPNRLAKTLTTGGCDEYHWSGKRYFHLRELASLMSFPSRWRMPSWHNRITVLRRQLGNAVPPKFAQAWFETIIAQLRASDLAEMNEFATEQRLSERVEVIHLD